MNRNGFTLVEVIGVLTILTLVIIVAFPNILSAINKTEEKMDNATTTLLIANAKSYWSDNVIMKTDTDYCVKIDTLINQNYTKTPISTVDETYEQTLKNNYCVTAEYAGSWNYNLTTSCGECSG